MRERKSYIFRRRTLRGHNSPGCAVTEALIRPYAFVDVFLVEVSGDPSKSTHVLE